MSGASVLVGGKLDGQALLATDANLAALVTAVNKMNIAVGATGVATPTGLMAVGIKSTADGKLYQWSGFGATDNTITPQIFISGASAQGNPGSGAPTAAFRIGAKATDNVFRDIGIDAAGALNLQSNGTAGSPIPSKATAVGGTDGANLQVISVDTTGAIRTQSSGAVGGSAPSLFQTVGGLDSNNQVRAAHVDTSGSLAISDNSAVPEAPISINGVAFTLGQGGAPTGPMTVNLTSTTILPDSTGGSTINGTRSQLEIVNVGTTDISVSPSTTAVWGVLWVIRPGGALVTTYSGPVSAISNNTASGASVSSPVNQISVAEWP